MLDEEWQISLVAHVKTRPRPYEECPRCDLHTKPQKMLGKLKSGFGSRIDSWCDERTLGGLRNETGWDCCQYRAVTFSYSHISQPDGIAQWESSGFLDIKHVAAEDQRW